MINTNKIKGRMAEMQLTQKAAAKELSIAQTTINQKISNNRPMDLAEAEKLAMLLKIPSEEFAVYFFCP